jgi:hypothetical protein
MRYRIYFENDPPVELLGTDLRVIRGRAVRVGAFVPLEATSLAAHTEANFASDIVRVADNHDRDVYVRTHTRFCASITEQVECNCGYDAARIT